MNGNKRKIAAHAQVVDGACSHFLARSGFAVDQRRRVTTGEALDERHRGLKDIRLANQAELVA